MEKKSDLGFVMETEWLGLRDGKEERLGVLTGNGVTRVS